MKNTQSYRGANKSNCLSIFKEDFFTTLFYHFTTLLNCPFCFRKKQWFALARNLIIMLIIFVDEKILFPMSQNTLIEIYQGSSSFRACGF